MRHWFVYRVPNEIDTDIHKGARPSGMELVKTGVSVDGETTKELFDRLENIQDWFILTNPGRYAVTGYNPEHCFTFWVDDEGVYHFGWFTWNAYAIKKSLR